MSLWNPSFLQASKAQRLNRRISFSFRSFVMTNFRTRNCYTIGFFSATDATAPEEGVERVM